MVFRFLIFLFFGPCLTMGQSYQTYPNCVPPCSLASYLNPPISGGPPCMCRMDAIPSGCQVPPCGPGDEIDGESGFLCQCTLYNVPESCVTLRCDNGTTSYAAIYSSCPAYSVLPGSYPTPSYPSSNYPSTNYPSPGYPSTNYPSSSFPSSSYPSSSYPSSSYPSSSYPSSSYPSSSYTSSNYPTSNYPANPTCSNYCYCQGDQPDFCTENDVGPFAGGNFCACGDFWPTGCVLAQCESGDDMWCECSPEFNGSLCYGARCNVS